MNREIGSGTKVLMYVVASIFELFQGLLTWIPLIGIVLAFIICPIVYMCALFIFWLWFKTYGVNIFSGPVSRGTLVSIPVEVLVGGIFPGIVLFVHSALRKASTTTSSGNAV